MLPQPTQLAFQAATRLGVTMAKMEGEIKPVLRNAHTYSSYVTFMISHRVLLEREPAFPHWDNLLVQLIEAEQHSKDMPDDVDSWNAQHEGIAVPLRFLVRLGIGDALAAAF